MVGHMFHLASYMIMVGHMLLHMACHIFRYVIGRMLLHLAGHISLPG